jgi:hypothetical protein
MDAAPGVVPGQHDAACSGVVQSQHQRCSGNSGDFRSWRKVRRNEPVGSAIGGFLYAHDLLYAAGYVGAAFVALALVTVIMTKGSAPR